MIDLTKLTEYEVLTIKPLPTSGSISASYGEGN